ncbi:SIP domain-containing protein [Microbacterium sp.]|uniref:SIP domain-containing protein n=1 Tax=Microbacterium sp. TaxID=51671 RepID=UPI0039E632E7
MARSLRPEAIFPITTRRLTVLRVADVTPGMRRITIGGPQLAAHVADNGFPVGAFRSPGWDDEFKLILPDPETGRFTAPTQADGTLDWPAGAFTDTRTYTVRRWDEAAGEIDVDVVKHGAGPATTWAYRCAPGDPIHIAGPKMAFGIPDVEWMLVAGDETALPAIGRLLEELPAGRLVDVIVEVGAAEHVQELTTRADATITWLSRDGRPAGTTTLLFDALRATPWRSDDVFAWVAGETLTLTPIRRWLRGDKQLAKERVEVCGYWRRAGAAAEGADQVPAPEDDAGERLHELLEIVPGVAIRVAVTVGLFAALGARPRSLAEVAAATATDPGALARLLRYLAELELVEADAAGVWSLTPLGSELDDEDETAGLDLRGAAARRELAIVGLLDAVRTGTAAHESTFGRSFPELVDADPELAASRLSSTFTEWTATPFAQSTLLEGVAELRLAGPGAAELARGVLEHRPETRVRLLLTPSQARVATAQSWTADERVRIETGGLLDRRMDRSDAYVLVSALEELPDADAVHVLAEAAASTHEGSVLVFEQLITELADEHEFEHDLVLLAATGGAMRTADEVDALARAAGLRLDVAVTVGWGAGLRRYVRG